MTADDVRARFEETVQRTGPRYMERDKHNGDYLDPGVEGMWRGYRAAHADLSGDPRSESGSAEEVAQWLYANGFREAAATIRNQLDVRNQRIADLSGEVRELVEWLDTALGKVSYAHLSLANNRVVGGSFAVDDETCCRWMGALNIAGARLDDLRRTLAKFHSTHQETK